MFHNDLSYTYGFEIDLLLRVFKVLLEMLNLKRQLNCSKLVLISKYRNPLKIKFQNSSPGIIVQKVNTNKKKSEGSSLYWLISQNEYLIAKLSNYFFCSKSIDTLLNSR